MTIDTSFGVLGAMILINIATVAFTYGRLSQRVADVCDRVRRLEDTMNGNKKER